MTQSKRPRETDAATFSRLKEIHHEMDELFVEHQIALLHFQIDKSRKLLLEFRARIEEHIRFEEEVLLPVYERSGGNEIEGGRVIFYLKEHQKILKLLAGVEITLSDLAAEDRDAGKILQLLEKEHTLKALLSHHDRREESFLYPFLDEVTSEYERDRMLSISKSKIHSEDAQLNQNSSTIRDEVARGDRETREDDAGGTQENSPK